LEPYYDKVDLYLGISGVKENLPHLPDSLFQRPNKLTAAEVGLRQSLKKMGRVLTPYRAGVTTDGVKHNKYRSKCYGRGACDRRPGGCDIHAVFDSPTGLIYPAMDTGHLTVRPNSTADRKSTRLNSSHDQISYAVFCLKKKKTKQNTRPIFGTQSLTSCNTKSVSSASCRSSFLRLASKLRVSWSNMAVRTNCF